MNAKSLLTRKQATVMLRTAGFIVADGTLAQKAFYQSGPERDFSQSCRGLYDPDKLMAWAIASLPSPTKRDAAPRVPAKYSTIKDFVAFSGISRSQVYNLLASGDLRAIKVRARTLIDMDAANAYLESRPEAVIRMPRELPK